MSMMQLRDFFFWNMVINFGLLFFSLVIILSIRKWAYRIHSSMFRLSEKQMDAIWYSILGGYKVLVFVFNVVPYIAICIMTK